MATTRLTRELVELSREGDREAFEELARRFTPRLEVQIDARMGAGVRAHMEPGDVLAETFAAALGSIDRLEWRGEEAFYRWLAGIAEHVIRNAARKRRSVPLELLGEVEGEDASPSRNLQRKERRDRLRDALRSLPTPRFQRGDANADSAVDLSDGVFILNWLFSGGEAPACLDAADTDDSGEIELTDAVALFNFLFLGGDAPPAPTPSSTTLVCGDDATDDDTLDCAAYAPCADG